jgi:hypothetical protein
MRKTSRFPRPLTHSNERCKHSDIGLDYECIQLPAMTVPSCWHPLFPTEPAHGAFRLRDDRYDRCENAPGSEPQSWRYDRYDHAIQSFMNIHEQV